MSDFRFKHFLLISVKIGILDNGEIQQLAFRIKHEIDYSEGGSLALLTCGAALTYRGLIKEIQELRLDEVNLSTIPTTHLISLISSVTRILDVDHNVTGCDLVTILDSLQCPEIGLRCNSLGRVEAQALVRAMESRVETLYLQDVMDMDINIRDLTKYSGQGRCSFISCEDVNDLNFIVELLRWGMEKEWYGSHYKKVEEDEDEGGKIRISISIKKKEEA